MMSDSTSFQLQLKTEFEYRLLDISAEPNVFYKIINEINRPQYFHPIYVSHLRLDRFLLNLFPVHWTIAVLLSTIGKIVICTLRNLMHQSFGFVVVIISFYTGFDHQAQMLRLWRRASKRDFGPNKKSKSHWRHAKEWCHQGFIKLLTCPSCFALGSKKETLFRFRFRKPFNKPSNQSFSLGSFLTQNKTERQFFYYDGG